MTNKICWLCKRQGKRDCKSRESSLLKGVYHMSRMCRHYHSIENTYCSKYDKYNSLDSETSICNELKCLRSKRSFNRATFSDLFGELLYGYCDS